MSETEQIIQMKKNFSKNLICEENLRIYTVSGMT